MRSQLLRRSGAIIAFLFAAVLAGAGVATASPANAAAPAAAPMVSSCASSYTCLWANAGFLGGKLSKSGNDSDMTKDAKGSGCKHVGFNDCASSVQNRGKTCTVYLWTSIGYHGRYHSLAKGDEVSNFASSASPPAGFADPSFNDAVSSLHWCTAR
jgi:peptidase inhibitor family I36